MPPRPLILLLLALAWPPAPAAQPVPLEIRHVASQAGTLRLSTMARGLANPWGLAFLPDGRVLVTERAGRLRILDGTTLSAPVTGLPVVWAQGQGGLLDVALDPQFSSNQRVYLSYAESGTGGAGTALLRGRLVGTALEDVQVIFRQEPKLSSGNHFGGRIAFSPGGHLYLVLGENNVRITAQHLDHHQGKVVRLWPDGAVPADNPFVGDPAALPDLWSRGHRNPQGAAINPWTGELWVVEHGPLGGDELNIVRAGRNYGWPVITHGLDYNGQPIPESVGTSAPGMEQPLYTWLPTSIAPSGLAFYASPRVPEWQGDLFLGALAGQRLVRLDLDAAGNVLAEERLLGGLNFRIRDVREGPDGALWLLTDSGDGRVMKLEPAKSRWRRELHAPPPAPPAPRPADGRHPPREPARLR